MQEELLSSRELQELVPQESIKKRVAILQIDEEGYLQLSIRSESTQDLLLEDYGFLSSDLDIKFWGDGVLDEVFELLEIQTKERLKIRKGDLIGKRVKEELILCWAKWNRDTRVKREKLIKDIDKISANLNRFFLRELRLENKAQEKTTSDIIQYMDGSVLLWLNVIFAAKRDFLKFHNDPEREKIEDYLSAKSFLFDEDYHILMDSPDKPEEENPKYVNLRGILELCLEVFNSLNSKESAPVEPSVEQLRESLALATGDVKLIVQFSKTKNNIV